MIKTRTLLLSNILAIIAGGMITLFVLMHHANSIKGPNVINALTADCPFSIARVKRYSYIKPLLYAEKDCEAKSFQPIKNHLNNIISAAMLNGQITSASVYICDLQKGDWTDCNPQLKYSMGALGKIPLLFTYLHKAETDIEVLNEMVMADMAGFTPTKASKIINGGKYSITQLIEYMMKEDDEKATYLLSKHVDQTLYKKTYTELNIDAPDLDNGHYEISTRDYSTFLIVLYNASYLSYSMSDYASSLLILGNKDSMADNYGLSNSRGLTMVHRWENKLLKVNELHLSSLFFINNRPYQVTIMSEGTNIEQSESVIRSIATALKTHLSQPF